MWGSVNLLPCPALETGPHPEREYSTIPHRQNSPPRRLGGCRSRASSVGGGALTHHASNMGVSPPPEMKTRLLRMPPKRATPPTASQNKAPHPPPAPARRPPSSPRDPRNGRRHSEPFRRGVPSSLGPGGASPGPGVGCSIPPRAPPSGTFQPPRSGSRRPSGARTGPLGSSGGERGPAGPFGHQGGMRGPEPLPAAAPLSAAQAASEVTAPASALSASSGTSSSMAARTDQPADGRAAGGCDPSGGRRR